MAINYEENIFDTKNKDDLHKKLYERFENLKKKKYLWEQQWIVNYLYIFTKDKYYLTTDGEIGRLVFKTGEDNPYLKISKLFPIYRATYSKIIKTNPILRIEPNEIYPDETEGKELAETLMKKEYSEWKKNGVISKALSWYIPTGNAFLKVVLKDNDKIIGYDTGKISAEELKVQPVNPLCVYFPFNYWINNIDDARYTYETIIIDRDIAVDKFGIEKDEAKIENSLKYKILLTGDYLNIENDIDIDQYAELILYIEKPNKLNPKGQFIIMTDKKILHHTDNPYPPEVGNPYSQAKMIETGFPLGETPITFSTAIDREIALSRGQLREHAKKLASPLMAIPMRSNVKSEKIGNRKVKAIYYDERYGTPKFIQPAEFTQYFWQNLALFEEDLMDINAIHDPSQAKRPKGVNSGIALAYLGEQDDLMHAPVVENFFAMIETAGRKYLKMLTEFFENDKIKVSSLSKDNISYVEFTGKQLKGNTNLKVVVNAGLPFNRIARQQVLMELGATKIIPTSMVRELLEFGELDQITRADEKDIVRQLMELEKMKKGESVEVYATDNHIVHVRQLINYTKTSEYMKLSDNVKNLIFSHIEAHIEQMVKNFDESPMIASMSLGLHALDPNEIQMVIAEIKKTKQQKEEMQTEQGQGQVVENLTNNKNEMEQAIVNYMQNKNGAPPRVKDLEASFNEQNIQNT